MMQYTQHASTPPAVAFYHGKFAAYVRQTQSPSRGTSHAISKLSKFSELHLVELSMDIYDEMQRRLDTRSEPGEHLPSRDDIHPKRNHARYQIGELSQSRFADMCQDLVTEHERRWPALREIKYRESGGDLQAQPPASTHPLQSDSSHPYSLPSPNSDADSSSLLSHMITSPNASGPVPQTHYSHNSESATSPHASFSAADGEISQLKIQNVSTSSVIPTRSEMIEDDDESGSEVSDILENVADDNEKTLSDKQHDNNKPAGTASTNDDDDGAQLPSSQVDRKAVVETTLAPPQDVEMISDYDTESDSDSMLRDRHSKHDQRALSDRSHTVPDQDDAANGTKAVNTGTGAHEIPAETSRNRSPTSDASPSSAAFESSSDRNENQDTKSLLASPLTSNASPLDGVTSALGKDTESPRTIQSSSDQTLLATPIPVDEVDTSSQMPPSSRSVTPELPTALVEEGDEENNNEASTPVSTSQEPGMQTRDVPTSAGASVQKAGPEMDKNPEAEDHSGSSTDVPRSIRTESVSKSNDEEPGPAVAPLAVSSESNRGSNKSIDMVPKTDYERLLQEHETLKKEHIDQRRITDQVRKEASLFLAEMRKLTERQSTSHDLVEKLTADVKNWKGRYAAVAADAKRQNSESGIHAALDISKLDRSVWNEKGLVEEAALIQFSLSVKRLILGVRQTPENVLGLLHAVVMAAWEVAPNNGSSPDALRDVVAQAVNQLISVVRNFSVTRGVLATILVDAAASDVCMAVNEFVQEVGVQPAAGSAGNGSESSRQAVPESASAQPRHQRSSSSSYIPIETSVSVVRANPSGHGRDESLVKSPSSSSARPIIASRSSVSSPPNDFQAHSAKVASREVNDNPEDGNSASSTHEPPKRIVEQVNSGDSAVPQSLKRTTSRPLPVPPTANDASPQKSPDRRRVSSETDDPAVVGGSNPVHAKQKQKQQQELRFKDDTDIINSSAHQRNDIESHNSASHAPSASNVPYGSDMTTDTKQLNTTVQKATSEASDKSPEHKRKPPSRRHPALEIPADSSIEELQAYLEEKTSGTVESIGAMLSGIRDNVTVGELEPNIDNIVASVDRMITATSTSMKQTRNGLLRDKGGFILENLRDCLDRMDALKEELTKTRTDAKPPRQLKQRLAGVSFDMAKSTKELVKTVEEVGITTELEQIDAQLN